MHFNKKKLCVLNLLKMQKWILQLEIRQLVSACMLGVANVKGMNESGKKQKKKKRQRKESHVHTVIAGQHPWTED